VTQTVGHDAPDASSQGQEATTSGRERGPAIETANIGRVFGTTPAVADLTLTVQRGGVFGLLGHSGAGKTTTIRLLTGVLRLSSGGASVPGMDPEVDGPAIRAPIGVLTETPALDERLTGRENLIVYAEMFGVPDPDIRRRVDDTLDLFNLRDRGDDRPMISCVMSSTGRIPAKRDSWHGIPSAALAVISDAAYHPSRSDASRGKTGHAQGDGMSTAARPQDVVISTGTLAALRRRPRLAIPPAALDRREIDEPAPDCERDQ
jgi:hypothetical protein